MWSVTWHPRLPSDIYIYAYAGERGKRRQERRKGEKQEKMNIAGGCQI